MQRDFKISLSQEYYSDVVFLSQYDDDLHLVFAVYDKYAKANSLNGLRAEFTGTRADRLGFTFESTVIGNKVTFVIDTTLSGLAGRHKGEIVFYDGTERMGSANVKIIVEPAARPDGTIDADVARAQEIAERVQEIVDTAKDEVEESLTSVKGDLTSLEGRVDALEQGGGTGGGVSTSVRQALLTLLKSAAYTETGLSDEIATIESWASAVTAISVSPSTASISGSATQQLTATTTPTGGTVTWSSSNTAVATVSSSGLVTGVSNGTCTITATSGDAHASCTVTVSGFATLVSIDATYTQTGTVTPEDSLSSLTSDLVVVATYDNSTTATLTSSQYTLSGTLTVGTSTITVSYGGKTDTFTVTVTSDLLYYWDLTNSLTDSVGGVTAVASAGTGVDAPAITSAGLAFNAATQRLSLGDIDLTGKTIEIDVASFDWKGNDSYHIRFLMNTSGRGPIIFKSANRWNCYAVTTTSGSGGWRGPWASDVNGGSNKNIFNGKTVKLVSETDGTWKLYIDSDLWGTLTGMSYGSDTQDVSIGGTSGYSQSSGDQCYDMTISAIRIKNNPSS